MAPPADHDGALRAAWNRRLYDWWRYFNREYAGSALREPLIELGGAVAQLGRWERATRRLVIAAAHIERDPWVEVLATLRHEMAHQFADEVLRARDEPAHGPAFRQAGHRLRCLPGGGTGARADGAPQDQTLERIRKVLSLTTSPNEHEAAAAVKQARRLLLRHNIEDVRLGQRREFVCRHLGPVKARHAAHELWLAQILHEFFFTEVIWAESYRAADDTCGSLLEVCGTPRNVDMAAYVFDYLSAKTEQLWQRYRSDRGLSGNRDRRRYLAGLLAGLCERLREQERRLGTEEALVWQGDGELRQFYRYLHPRVRNRPGGGVPATAVYHDGVAAGRRIVIHRAVAGSDAGVRGYLGRG